MVYLEWCLSVPGVGARPIAHRLDPRLNNVMQQTICHPMLFLIYLSALLIRRSGMFAKLRDKSAFQPGKLETLSNIPKYYVKMLMTFHYTFVT